MLTGLANPWFPTLCRVEGDKIFWYVILSGFGCYAGLYALLSLVLTFLLGFPRDYINTELAFVWVRYPEEFNLRWPYWLLNTLSGISLSMVLASLYLCFLFLCVRDAWVLLTGRLRSSSIVMISCWSELTYYKVLDTISLFASSLF